MATLYKAIQTGGKSMFTLVLIGLGMWSGLVSHSHTDYERKHKDRAAREHRL